MKHMVGLGAAALAALFAASPALAQSAANLFRTGQQIVVDYNGTYYYGNVQAVQPEGSCTKIDYSFGDGRLSGSGYDYPDCLDPSIFTLEQAAARGIRVAGAAPSGGGTPGGGGGTPAGGGAPAGGGTPAGGGGAGGNMSAEIVSAHNVYRQQLGIPGLSWSATLAQGAQSWADQMAASGNFSHSNTNLGENLWAGSAGAYSYKSMVDAWGAERQYFRYGVFPDVSTTGNWAAVGHYTQVIWRNTTQVGCGKATGGGNDYLVCRYSPAGNFQGQTPY